MTTAVYFDLDGTLLERTARHDEILARTLDAETAPEAEATFSKQTLERIDAIHGKPYRGAFAAVREEHGLEVDPATAANDYIEAEAAATRLDPRVRRLAETVVARHPTGVLTNGHGPTQRQKLAEHDLDGLFDAVVVSNEVGARKPDPAVFEEARERLPADTHIYIGDSYEEDIVPAEELGFETVYVGDEPRPEASVSAAGTGTLAPVLLALLDD